MTSLTDLPPELLYEIFLQLETSKTDLTALLHVDMYIRDVTLSLDIDWYRLYGTDLQNSIRRVKEQVESNRSMLSNPLLFPVVGGDNALMFQIRNALNYLSICGRKDDIHSFCVFIKRLNYYELLDNDVKIDVENLLRVTKKNELSKGVLAGVAFMILVIGFLLLKI